MNDQLVAPAPTLQTARARRQPLRMSASGPRTALSDLAEQLRTSAPDGPNGVFRFGGNRPGSNTVSGRGAWMDRRSDTDSVLSRVSVSFSGLWSF